MSRDLMNQQQLRFQNHSNIAGTQIQPVMFVIRKIYNWPLYSIPLHYILLNYIVKQYTGKSVINNTLQTPFWYPIDNGILFSCLQDDSIAFATALPQWQQCSSSLCVTILHLEGSTLATEKHNTRSHFSIMSQILLEWPNLTKMGHST